MSAESFETCESVATEEDTMDKRRFNYMENVLQHVITKITLKEEDTRLHNQVLKTAIGIILDKMKSTSTVFSKIFTTIFYGGSYYDNLKTDNPDEYDIDLLMILSKKQAFILKSIEEAPGFVTLEKANDLVELSEFFDGDFLCSKKVLAWMESLLSTTLANLLSSGRQNMLRIMDNDFFIKIAKSGPAFSIKLNGEIDGQRMNFDVDFVPCFLFHANAWPRGRFRQNPVQKKTDFFIVPKQPKNQISVATNRCWRLSFQEQERELIRGNLTLQGSIKLMKKLRDRLQHNAISSYFIKTMFLWQVERRDKSFWENSLSYVFVEMLQVYEKHMRERNIEYFWNSKSNLIGSLSQTMVDNYANHVKRIISDIFNKEIGNPYYIAKYFLTDEEMKQLQADVPAPVKEISGLSDDNGDSETKSSAGCSPTSSTQCCHSSQMDVTLNDIRKEIAEARREQEALKLNILELLRIVVRRLDEMDFKNAKN